MKIGLASVFWLPFCTPEVLEAIGIESENYGVDSVWAGEHAVWFDNFNSPYPNAVTAKRENGLLEPTTALSFLAACTSTLRLATGILLVPQRNPVYMAQQTAMVDWLSNGRHIVGIGTGWQREEFDALQTPFERRGARTDEYMAVVKSLWCDDISSFSGEFYDLPSSRMYPRPVQRPHPPIHVGGNSDAALRRVASIGQGWYALRLSPPELSNRLEALDALLGERGRTRAEIEVSMFYTAPDSLEEVIPKFAALGLDTLVVQVDSHSVDVFRRALDRLAPAIELARTV